MFGVRISTAVLCFTLVGCQVGPRLAQTPSDDVAFRAAAVDAYSSPVESDNDSTGEVVNPLRVAHEPRPSKTQGVPHGQHRVRAASAVDPGEGLPGPFASLAFEDLPPAGVAGSSALTLEDLEQMAAVNNPAVARAEAQIRALRGKWVQVGLPPNPIIGYRGEEIGAGGDAGMQGGYFGQQFVRGGKLGLNRAVVSQEIAAAEQEWAAVLARVRTDVRLTYYDVLIAQRRIELARELLAIGERAAAASQELLSAGEIPRIGLLQTEIEARTAQIVLQRAENDLTAAWQRLTSVVGIPQLARTRLAGSLDGASVHLDFDQEMTRLTNQSPEMAAAVAEVARAQWAVQRACAEVVPDVTAQAAVMHNTNSHFTVAGAQIALPWPLWNRNQGGIRQAQEEVLAARRNVARTELDLRQRLADAFRQYADARVQVEIYTTEIVPKAKETLDLVDVGYRAEEVGYLDLLTAQRTYFQTTLAYIDALRELWRATMRIDGMLLEGSLQGEGR